MGLGSDFIQWVRTLLNDQRSCVMNNGTTTGYFNLNRGTRQGDLLSAYLFALAIEVLFIILLILVGVELPLRVVVTILECCHVFWSQVEYKIVCFIYKRKC